MLYLYYIGYTLIYAYQNFYPISTIEEYSYFIEVGKAFTISIKSLPYLLLPVFS